MKTFRNFVHQLDETLTKQQRKWVDKRLWRIGSEHDWLFKEPHLHTEGAKKIDDNTFTIPLTPVDKTRENQIRNHLQQHGYTIHDYVNDDITDKHGRKTSIGKALGRTEKDANLYATDPRVRARKTGEISDDDTHEIVISRDPYHVAGMSSGRHWSSCMTLPGDVTHPGGGMYHHKVAKDLEHNSLVAYLTKKGEIKPDKELTADQALSRILLKKYEGGSNDIFRANPSSYSPPSAYGIGSSREKYPQFEKAVKDFGEQKWKADDNDIYFLHPDLYPDGSPKRLLSKEQEKWSPELLNNYAKHVSDLEDRYNDYDIKPNEHDNLHEHRMIIAEHPNTSSKTLDNLLPDFSESRYDKYNDKHYNNALNGGWNPKGELINAIANHKNVATDTLHDILMSADSDDLEDSDKLRTKLLSRSDIDSTDLHEHRGFTPEHDLMIAKHPNVSGTTLSDLYDDHSKELKDGYYGEAKDHENVIKAIAAKTDWPSLHDQILDDIKEGHYNKDFHHDLLSTIAKHSNDPNVLHRVALMPDPNHSTHNAIQRFITKNPTTESHTLDHIKNNLTRQHDKEVPKLVHPITDDYQHESNNWGQGKYHYIPHTKSWIRIHKDRGDLVESPVIPEHIKKLNKEHASEIKQINSEHENNVKQAQEKILTNIAKHKNTPMLAVKDFVNHENPVIANIAKDRLEKDRFRKFV